MKLSPVLSQLLKKHKLVGAPAKAIEPEEETKESVYKALAKNVFFEEIEECENRGILLAYDELIEYAAQEMKGSSYAEESDYIENQLKIIFRENFHSSYLSVYRDRYYLYIKYREEPDSIIIGPEKHQTKKSKESKEYEIFREMWKNRTEYRKFADGKIRICASFQNCKPDTAKYEIISKIFQIEITKDQTKDQTERKGRILTPPLPVSILDKLFEESNSKKSNDLISKTLETVRSHFPVTLLEYTYTGSYRRKTKAQAQKRTQIYLKVGRGHIWPKDNKELSDASITALNAVLGKSLEGKARNQGVSKDNTLYCNIFGEEVEFIFDVEGERKIHPEKYRLSDLRTSYECFFQEITEKNKIFPKLCSLIKNLLYSHGIYPHYITDKAVEILCYRTGYTARTLGGGLRAVVSTQYARGYAIDIRRGKHKIRAKQTGKIEITHRTGTFDIDLPDEKLFTKINQIFMNSLKIIENTAEVSTEHGAFYAYSQIFTPSLEGITFSLSRVPVQGYKEVSHYSKVLGGTKGSNESACFSSLQDIGCRPYFCKGKTLHVEVEKEESTKMAVGIAVLLTGMKFIKTRKD